MKHLFDLPFLFHSIRGLCNGNYYLPLRELMDLRPGDRILEVGCGTGEGSVLAGEGIEYLGVDTDANYIQYATQNRSRPGVAFQQADVHGVQGFFTKAIVMCTLHHLSDDQVRSLAECLHRLVSGIVSVTEPDPVSSRGVQQFLLKFDRGQYVRPIPEHLRLLVDRYDCETVLTCNTPRLHLARLSYSLCRPRTATPVQ